MNVVSRWATISSLALAVASGPAAAAALAPGGAGADIVDAPSAGDAGDDTVDLVVHRATPGEAGQGEAAAVTLDAHPRATVQRPMPRLGADVVTVPAAAADRVADQLADADGVAHVERDGVAHTTGDGAGLAGAAGLGGAATLAATTSETDTADAVTPNDPRWPDQWGLQRIEAPSAWTATTGDADVTVAVLDTGVDPDHPDLAANLTTGRDFTVAGGGGSDTDDHDDPATGQAGHGTMSAGVLAAVTDNDEGVAGTCWTCTVLPVRVMEPDGTGALSRIADGIVWAVDQGADVINLSLGSRDDLRVMREAVGYAVEHDVVLVSAAGNLAGDTPIYPGAYDAVVGVAASTRDDTRSPFSSHGSWVDVAAPGCNPSTRPDGGYTSTPFCGTSSAAPQVSGVMALALAANSDVTPWQAVAALGDAAQPVGDWVRHGRLDATATLDGLADVGPASAPPRPDDQGGDGETGTEPGTARRRVAGTDRFDTAARLSQDRFEPGVDRVHVATGEAFPDALAAGAAAGAVDGPVLLAAEDTLPRPTRDELARLQPDEVVVVGGTGVLDESVRHAAGEAAGAPARRVAGRERFATAAELAVDAFPDGAPVAYVATGQEFADALAGVPAAVAEGGPVLLTAEGHVPEATRQALTQLAPERIVVLGGTEAVSTSAGVELAGLAGPGGAQRLAGTDRFATAAHVADAVFDPQPPTAHLATGTDFPDALAGGPAAAAVNSPLLLVTRQTLPAATADELQRLRPQANVTLGGSEVVSAAVETAAAEAAAGS